MSIVVQVLDKMIAAAQSVDSKLHASLDYLIELREKLTTFAADSVEADELVGELRALESAA